MINVKQILIDSYGQDISLNDLSFIKELSDKTEYLDSFIQFFNDQIIYKKVGILGSKKDFDIFYFINVRLIELLLDELRKQEPNYTNINVIFDELFAPSYEDDESNYPKYKFMLDVLISNITVIDIYFNVPLYIDTILSEYKYSVDYKEMTFSDILTVIEQFNLMMLPSKVTIDLAYQVENMFNNSWFCTIFNINKTELAEYIENM